MNQTAYTCVCCGFRTLPEPVGSYEICPVCFWEDDLVQLAFPNMNGGANKVSLIEGQTNFMAHGVCEPAMKKHVRPATRDEPRDPTWTPYNSSEHRGLDSSSKSDSALWDKVQDCSPNLYYWRANFWRGL